MYCDIYIKDKENVVCIEKRNKREAMRIISALYDSNVFQDSYVDEIKTNGEVRIVYFRDFILEIY